MCTYMHVTMDWSELAILLNLEIRIQIEKKNTAITMDDA